MKGRKSAAKKAEPHSGQSVLEAASKGLSLQFLGGAGTVTGSKTLISFSGRKFLVDCGLFEGLKDLRLRNWESFPIDPSQLECVILTHAHLDHSGYLPLLTKTGFSGKIFCTAPTRDLCKILLMDSAKIQEEDAAYANKMGFSKHSPAKPLYTREDAEATFGLFRPTDENKWIEIFAGCKLRFRNSGHILGSAFVELDVGGTRVVFSGDLGRSKPLILRPPCRIEQADILVLESTYGDRNHSFPSGCKDPLELLARITNETVARKGHLLIPSFAVGRTQDLLFLFSVLKAQKKIPDVPIFLDTPLGISATEILSRNSSWHSLNQKKIAAIQQVATMVKSQQQSLELVRRRDSAIVIAGSGMVNGGRILQHLARRVQNPKNTVLLVGFQAAGTRGRQLEEGASEVKIYGQYVPVKCQIAKIECLSAHADQRETLSWLKGFTKFPKTIFINHGEAHSSDALRAKLSSEFGAKCIIPKHLETFT